MQRVSWFCSSLTCAGRMSFSPEMTASHYWLRSPVSGPTAYEHRCAQALSSALHTSAPLQIQFLHRFLVGSRLRIRADELLNMERLSSGKLLNWLCSRTEKKKQQWIHPGSSCFCCTYRSGRRDVSSYRSGVPCDPGRLEVIAAVLRNFFLGGK